MRDAGLNTVTRDPSPDQVRQPVATPFDVLADPDVEQLLPAALNFWPRGAVFGSPDGLAVDTSSNWAKLTQVLLSPFVTLYRRAFLLALEASPATFDQTLEDWETEYGLPDSCVQAEQTRAERIAAVVAKVNAAPLITPGDFVRLALDYGFVVEIEEPAVFECGFSECGGEHATGAWSQEIYWIVRVSEVAVFYFRTGEGECGADPLFSFGDAERLLCILMRLSPAWTIPVLEIVEPNP
ncbi:putative phage tail protein [Mesorhizobium sp. 1M-11]|uniref:putative phage tail protein n=1 Tax=Mesorhizobium sp. 1M-11 TaxID=1529006 RepID=UPI0009EC03A9|nr:putative phage tail protein [Mesorhizobium sp. 1M-11]